MVKKKLVKRFTYEGFGFPVHLSGRVPVVCVMGVEVLGIQQGTLKELVALELARAPWRLTGYQLHFLRSFFRMTLQEFGARFGEVTHVAVIGWQKKGSETTGMGWAIEKDLRLAVIERICSEQMQAVYAELATPKKVAHDEQVINVGFLEAS